MMLCLSLNYIMVGHHHQTSHLRSCQMDFACCLAMLSIDHSQSVEEVAASLRRGHLRCEASVLNSRSAIPVELLDLCRYHQLLDAIRNTRVDSYSARLDLICGCACCYDRPTLGGDNFEICARNQTVHGAFSTLPTERVKLKIDDHVL